MKQVPAILFVIAFTAVTSCSRSSKKLCFTPPDPVLLRWIDHNGQDLLKPTNLNSYKAAGLTLTYTENGTSRIVPTGINSFPNTDTFFLSTDMGWYADKGRTFLLKLSDTDTDTLDLQYDKINDNGCTYYSLKAFKYNNVLCHQKLIVTGQPNVFEIVK